MKDHVFTRQAAVPALKVPDESRRDTLVLAAARMFRAQGYERTTVRELAAAVGLQSGSLFHHFRNKEEILLAVMTQGIQSVIDEGQALLDGHGSAAQRLEGLFRLHMNSLIHGVGGNAMHAIIFEWRSLSPEGRERVRERSDAYEALWHRAISDAISAGLLSGDAVVLRKYVLGGMNHMVRWYKPDGRIASDRFIESMLEAAFPQLDAGWGRNHESG